MESKNTTPRKQGPARPSDARAGAQGSRVSSGTYTSGSPSPARPRPYDRPGHQTPQKTSVRPSHDVQGPQRQTATSSAPITPKKKQATVNPPASNVEVVSKSLFNLGPLQVFPDTDFIVLYVSAEGAPLFFGKHDEGQPVAWRLSRARVSTAWVRPSLRAALWANPDKRRQLLLSAFRVPEPMSVEESNQLVLNDIRLLLRLDTTQEDFWKTLESFFPSNLGIPYTITEWAIICPRCGMEVIGNVDDTLWSKRYLSHRKKVCGKPLDGKHA
ncbi:hypothetical protein HYPSUDRAFT_448559 [Hypholoma sublateritium FD-334 SS-4]|uniref:Uncharacterized protein n=1 Tax=Hypholoma sublateritium (strain FD-334 SS-4) TaxID=945553 RepID=A0A0D2LTW8_HYPSF|nr:hypothetical protein HYPSUDRAFT_448559 [Hypholoma sublateritium FD-334 SS-4]